MDKFELRISRLEKEMETVCADLKELMTNHIPHIQVELEELRGEIKALSNSVKIFGGIIMLAIGALIGVVLGT